MSEENRTVEPAFPYEFVRLEDGTKVRPPEGWSLLKPGDATLTRRVKAAGPSWTVQVKKGRKVFSQGVWAAAETIQRVIAELEAERSTPEYEAQLAKGRERRAKDEAQYQGDFVAAVVGFLAFAPEHSALGQTLAERVAAHATPVGSGTVARTKRIPIEQRAESALIAWMRHQTTAYDHLKIARVKGARREVRRELAKESRRRLAAYRPGGKPDPACPLAAAITHPNEKAG
jgi:hypothetical protein